MHRCFGNPIHIDHPRALRMIFEPGSETLRFEGFAAEHDRLKTELMPSLRL
nr:hypothetical protein CPGR_00746 [Mycolicibacterium malmesburyense]